MYRLAADGQCYRNLSCLRSSQFEISTLSRLKMSSAVHSWTYSFRSRTVRSKNARRICKRCSVFGRFSFGRFRPGSEEQVHSSSPERLHLGIELTCVVILDFFFSELVCCFPPFIWSRQQFAFHNPDHEWDAFLDLPVDTTHSEWIFHTTSWGSKCPRQSIDR
jgi:hypothetical protein